jgi:hypothetical protein
MGPSQVAHLATHSIHFAIPPACSMTLLASAYAFWHRSHAARDTGGSNTTFGRFSLTLAIVLAKSKSTSVTRRRVRCGLALGRRTMWPVIDGRDGCPAFTDPRVAQVPAERVGLGLRHLRQAQAPGSPTGAVVPQAGALSTLGSEPFRAELGVSRTSQHPGRSPWRFAGSSTTASTARTSI